LFPFFFQAEDGIRDFHVTGVQTCALPISGGAHVGSILKNLDKFHLYDPETKDDPDTMKTFVDASRMASEFDWKGLLSRFDVRPRSEERRVGKEGRGGRMLTGG